VQREIGVFAPRCMSHLLCSYTDLIVERKILLYTLADPLRSGWLAQFSVRSTIAMQGVEERRSLERITPDC
jgi:hypothetical protein